MDDAHGSFFNRLEAELRAAAEPSARRRRAAWASTARGGVVAVAASAIAALLVVSALVVLGGGEGGDTTDRGGTADRSTPASSADLPAIGTVIPKGSGTPPRTQESVVVATGVAPVVGPWQLEAYRGGGLRDPETGEVYEPAGLRCLSLFVLQPRNDSSGGSGSCGERPRTPGFSLNQLAVPGVVGKPIEEVLLSGRVPKQASAVVLTLPDGRSVEAELFDAPDGIDSAHYVLALSSLPEGARINWLDRDGNAGSRGLPLMPR